MAGGLFAFGLSGCKNNDLAVREASRTLAATAFSPPQAVQTLTFTSGESRTPRAQAIDSFLYAKHWLECKDTQPGLFSRVAVCTLDTAGLTFARENNWHATHVAAGCALCETWTVPLARATLRSVTGLMQRDKTHAVATYAYEVVPNAFGGELGDWMTKNSDAWCGPDPRAAGGWGRTRDGQADFVRAGSSWTVADAAPGATFAGTFGAPAPDRPCAAP